MLIKRDYNKILMICFGNNVSFDCDWQIAYQQLYAVYTQLNLDYQKASQLGMVLALKVQTLAKEVEEIRARKITKTFSVIPNQVATTLSTIPLSEREITIKETPKKSEKPKNLPPLETNEEGIYQCTYHGCGRIYQSSASLNLHIKMKHNGGTKKQREEYAKIIIDAEERGDEPPSVPINFPPNFLEEFRMTYHYIKKYSM